MGSVFLVRHATTSASAAGRNLGQADDAPLTPDGWRLAGALGRAIELELAAQPLAQTRMVSSPARRCRETTVAIANAIAHAADSEIEPGLRELDYGAWEGLTADECRRRDPELRAAWEADPYAISTPGGESGADVATRAFPVLERLERWAAGEDTRVAIVVSHNHVIRLRLARLLGVPLRDYRRAVRVEPGSCSLVSFHGEPPQATVGRLSAMPLLGDPGGWHL